MVFRPRWNTLEINSNHPECNFGAIVIFPWNAIGLVLSTNWAVFLCGSGNTFREEDFFFHHCSPRLFITRTCNSVRYNEAVGRRLLPPINTLIRWFIRPHSADKVHNKLHSTLVAQWTLIETDRETVYMSAASSVWKPAILVACSSRELGCSVCVRHREG